MKIYAYTDPNRAYSADRSFALRNLMQKHPSAIARDCNGTPVTNHNGGGILTDLRTPDALAHFREIIADIQGQSPGVRWDAFFDDDAGNLMYTDDDRVPCGADELQWIAAATRIEAAVGVPIIFNALSIGPQMLTLADPPNVLGGMYESCYAYHGDHGIKGDGLVSDSEWRTTEEIEIAMARRKKLFWCYARNTVDPSTTAGIESRLYVYASFLLGYDPQTSLIEEEYRVPSALPVMPETFLVPLRSLRVPSGVEQLQGPTGTYDRRFAACYLSGRLVGGCAVAVNPSATRWLRYPFGSTYRHTLELVGKGVMEGGRARVDGPPPPQKIAPKSAVIVFR